jgi:hypothetical protein
MGRQNGTRMSMQPQTTDSQFIRTAKRVFPIYRDNGGILPLDRMVEIENAGFVIEDIEAWCDQHMTKGDD